MQITKVIYYNLFFNIFLVEEWGEDIPESSQANKVVGTKKGKKG